MGVLTSLFERAEPAVATVCERALDELPGRKEPVTLPLHDELSTITQLIMLPEAANAHLPWLRTRLADYGADVRARLLAGLLLPSTAYVTGLRARRWARAEYERALGGYDVLVAPAMPITAPRLDAIPEDYRLLLMPYNSPAALLGLPALSAALRLRRRPAGRAVADRPAGRGRYAAGRGQGIPAGDRLARAASGAGAGTRCRLTGPGDGCIQPADSSERGGSTMSVLIKGGRIITAADDYVGDIFVDNGSVTLIGESLDVVADKVIDAGGKYVIPGAIDPHTHIEMFFGGTTTCDDFTSGTVSAAFGGTTTVIDFCMQAPGTTFAEALENYHEKIDRCKPVIDVGFHIGVTDLHTGGTLEDLAKLPDEGVTSYKLFMAYKGAVMVDDDTLFRTMLNAADSGALVMVHAENGDAIDLIVKKAVAEGKTEPIWHARTRPMETEAEATNRAVQLSRVAGCPLYVVHVSCQPAVEPIQLAREKGWDV